MWRLTEEENVPLRTGVGALYDPETGIDWISTGIIWAPPPGKKNTPASLGQLRRAESFLTSEGAVDYTRDANAVWCMEEAVRLGASQVVLPTRPR